VPEPYCDRTGNAGICCLAGDMRRFSYVSTLVAEIDTTGLKIRPVSVRVRLGALVYVHRCHHVTSPSLSQCHELSQPDRNSVGRPSGPRLGWARRPTA